MLWELRNLRRRRGKCFGSCATCAVVSAKALGSAQPAPMSRQMLWELRNLRRRHSKCFGSCATCADVAANALGVAQPAPLSRQKLWELRNLRRCRGKCREIHTTMRNPCCLFLGELLAEAAKSEEGLQSFRSNSRVIRNKRAVSSVADGAARFVIVPADAGRPFCRFTDSFSLLAFHFPSDDRHAEHQGEEDE